MCFRARPMDREKNTTPRRRRRVVCRWRLVTLRCDRPTEPTNVSRKIRCNGSSFRPHWRRETGDTLRTTKYASGTTKVAPNSNARNRRRSQGLIWPARIDNVNCVIFVNRIFFFFHSFHTTRPLCIIIIISFPSPAIIIIMVCAKCTFCNIIVIIMLLLSLHNTLRCHPIHEKYALHYHGLRSLTNGDGDRQNVNNGGGGSDDPRFWKYGPRPTCAEKRFDNKIKAPTRDIQPWLRELFFLLSKTSC